MEHTVHDVGDQLALLYVTYRKKFCMNVAGQIFTPKTSSGDYRTLTSGYLYNHVMRKYAVCVFSGESGTKFMCFDVDMMDIEVVKSIVSILKDAGIPEESLAVSTSGNKGYHVDVFFDNLVPLEDCKRLYEYVLSKMDVDERKVELRPTNRQSIKLPLSVNSKTGNICWYMDDNFEIVEDHSPIFSMKGMSSTSFSAMVKKLDYVPKTKAIHVKEVPVIEIKDEFNLPVITAAGMRHHMMVNIAMFLRSRYHTQEEIEYILGQWISSQDRKLFHSTEEEIRKDIVSVSQWVSSDSYSPVAKGKTYVTINRDLLDQCVKYKHNARKIAFLLFATTASLGSWKTSKLWMAERLNMTEMTVQNCLKKLIADEVIRSHQGTSKKTADNKFQKERNTYTSTIRVRRDSDSLRFDVDDMNRDPALCMAEAFSQFYSEAELKKIFTKKELDELKGLIEDKCRKKDD